MEHCSTNGSVSRGTALDVGMDEGTTNKNIVETVDGTLVIIKKSEGDDVISGWLKAVGPADIMMH